MFSCKKKKYYIPPREPFAQYVQLLCEKVWSTHRRVSCFHLVQQEEKNAPRLGRTRPKHHCVRESCSWFFDGSWERKRRTIILQTSPYLRRPSKFSETRRAATSPSLPVCPPANLVFGLAFVRPIHSTEVTKKHREPGPVIRIFSVAGTVYINRRIRVRVPAACLFKCISKRYA